jgi:hypothetical protein
MPEDSTLSPLDAKNAEERRITLEGPKDPENFIMPDGRTFAQTQRDKFEQDTKEGLEADQIQQQRVREQSMASDPLYTNVPLADRVTESPPKTKEEVKKASPEKITETPKEAPKQKEI